MALIWSVEFSIEEEDLNKQNLRLSIAFQFVKNNYFPAPQY